MSIEREPELQAPAPPSESFLVPAPGSRSTALLYVVSDFFRNFLDILDCMEQNAEDMSIRLLPKPRRPDCRVIADFAISLNLLCIFSKQTSTVVSSQTSTNAIPSLHIFRFLQHSIFRLYFRTFTTPICVRLMPSAFVG